MFLSLSLRLKVLHSSSPDPLLFPPEIISITIITVISRQLIMDLSQQCVYQTDFGEEEATQECVYQDAFEEAFPIHEKQEEPKEEDQELGPVEAGKKEEQKLGSVEEGKKEDQLGTIEEGKKEDLHQEGKKEGRGKKRAPPVPAFPENLPAGLPTFGHHDAPSAKKEKTDHPTDDGSQGSLDLIMD